MNSKIFRPFAQSLPLAVIHSLFADDKTEAPRPVPDSLEGKTSKVCRG